jgi:hypothetical protein
MQQPMKKLWQRQRRLWQDQFPHQQRQRLLLLQIK